MLSLFNKFFYILKEMFAGRAIVFAVFKKRGGSAAYYAVSLCYYTRGCLLLKK